MAVRTSMASLISRTRDRIRDPAGGGQHFGDQEIQDALDPTRQTVRLLILTPQPSISSSNGVQWLTFLAPLGDWELDATVQNNSYSVLSSPADYTLDDITGTVTTVASQYPPLYLNGQTYDCWAAAAELLERWARDLDLTDVDFKADGTQVSLSQRAAGKRQAAKDCRAQSRIRPLALQRADMPQPVYPRIGRRIPREYR